MSTSVNWRRTRAMSMPTVLILWAASTAHVGKALKEMGSTVQVNSTFVHKALCTYLVTILTFVVDIPECERGLDGCDSNSTCANTIGSYLCSCNSGFTGDGFTCIG